MARPTITRTELTELSATWRALGLATVGEIEAIITPAIERLADLERQTRAIRTGNGERRDLIRRVADGRLDVLTGAATAQLLADGPLDQHNAALRVGQEAIAVVRGDAHRRLVEIADRLVADLGQAFAARVDRAAQLLPAVELVATDADAALAGGDTLTAWGELAGLAADCDRLRAARTLLSWRRIVVTTGPGGGFGQWRRPDLLPLGFNHLAAAPRLRAEIASGAAPGIYTAAEAATFAAEAEHAELADLPT